MSGNFKFLHINIGAKKIQKKNDITAINIGSGKEKKAKHKKNNVRKIIKWKPKLNKKIKKKKKLKYDQIKQLDADDLFSYITGDTPKEDGKKQQKSREKRIQS